MSRPYTTVRLERVQEAYIDVFDDEIEPGVSHIDQAWEIIRAFPDWDTIDTYHEVWRMGEE